MKYFIMSDVHGEYDKMISALHAAGYRGSANQKIISLGDPFDRGKKSYDVLKFLLDSNAILVRGNHDARLKECFDEPDKICMNDIFNGMDKTIKSFFGKGGSYSDTLFANVLDAKIDNRVAYQEFCKYWMLSVWAIETSDMIFCHAWIPSNKDDTYDKNWRKADTDKWYDTSWLSTANMIEHKIFEPHKTIVVGHYATALLRAYFDEERIDLSEITSLDCDIYKYPGCVCIDGSANDKKGKVNVFIYETDEPLKFYKGEKE